MIIDLDQFVRRERPYWEELEGMLDRLERDVSARLDLKGVERLHFLYQRASTDLTKLESFVSEPELKAYLDRLVGRAFGEIHESRFESGKWNFLRWIWPGFPRAVRRHAAALCVALGITLLGVVFGASMTGLDRDAKEVLIPFSALWGDPSDRVAEEESGRNEELEGRQFSFSGMLMTHNTRVAVFCLALGITFGLGTCVLLFYNGAMLGAVVLDYVRAGETTFLMGWLLPHGAVEIPAFILAGQAGLVLAAALFGGRRGIPAGERFKAVSNDLVLLVSGVAILLVWAGVVEAFLSQYHEPFMPYEAKIGLGVVELIALVLVLVRGGRATKDAGVAGDG